MFVEVLLGLDIEDWCANILKFSCSLGHLKLFRSLHDLLKLRQEASRENVILSKFEAIKD
jgi:hypothetical protein